MQTNRSYEPNRFFEIVDDLSLFYFRGYNLFKLFYFTFVIEQEKRIGGERVKPRRDWVWALSKSVNLFKALAVAVYVGLRSRMAPRVLFYGTSGRHAVIGDTTYDLYNARLVDQKRRNQFIIIEDAGDGVSKQYRPDFCLHDFAVLIGLLYGISRLILARDLRQYSQTLVNRYPELGFNEAEAARKVLLFYAKFLTYRFLLTLLAPERVLLMAHTGKEAFIAACKHRHIQVIELMHGMIAAHPFYNFPKSYSYLFRQALFPDKLAVYGEYWKQVAIQGNMFPEDSIIVVGYYLKVPEKSERPVSRDRSVILISAQGIFQRELCHYISFLKSQLDSNQWHIIIKPHPHDDSQAYVNVLQPGFVTLTNKNAYELLAQADIHISFYSTLLYEAVRYNVCNYVLLVDGAPEQCHIIINSGVAWPLMPDQVPEIGKKPGVAAQFYFADFNPSVLFEP